MTQFDPLAFRDNFPAFAAMKAEGRPFHYLDSGASTLAAAPVIAAMADHDTRLRANVHRSVHYWAEQATQAYEATRDSLAAYFGASRDEIVLTSGTTQALNIIAYGLSDRLGPGDEVLISTDNHHANIVSWQIHAAAKGATLKPIGLDGHGRIDEAALIAQLSPNTRIIALSHISNVTGWEVDLAQLGRLIKSHAPNAIIVVDGAQSACHWPLFSTTLPDLPIDFYACSAHKMFGPTGVGMFWGRAALLDDMPPLLGGGEMINSVSFDGTSFAAPPTRFEAGTPPITQAVGFHAAITFLSQLDHKAIRAHEAALADNLAAQLAGMATILGGASFTQSRAPIISFAIKGCHPHDICQLSDRTGVAMRGGHHCAQPLMAHFNLLATSRASLSAYSTQDDCDAAIAAIRDAVQLLKGD